MHPCLVQAGPRPSSVACESINRSSSLSSSLSRRTSTSSSCRAAAVMGNSTAATVGATIGGIAGLALIAWPVAIWWEVRRFTLRL